MYSTKEKALKVLDMIEDAILECECMRTGHAEYDFGHSCSICQWKVKHEKGY